MIYVAAQNAKEQSQTTVFLSKNKKTLREMGFRWINTFRNEQRAIIWINESYFFNIKEFLY